MLLRPEILDVIAPSVGALGALAIWLRELPAPTTGRACPRCGTMQPLPSRTSVLVRHIFEDNCVRCHKSFERPRLPG